MAQAKKQAAARSGLVNLRMSPEDRAVIDRAARTAGKTRTEFMVEAARQAARETLLDTMLILTDGATFHRFRDMFDAPPQPNPRLRKLMSRTAPWEA